MAREKDKMRSDYALYTVAIIFFIITGIVFAIQMEETYKSLGIIATTVLGIFFIGLGYTQRPKTKAQTVAAPPPKSRIHTLKIFTIFLLSSLFMASKNSLRLFPDKLKL